jgi:hypothetical protein
MLPKLKRIIIPPSIPPSSISTGGGGTATGKTPSAIVDTASTLLSVQIDHTTAISNNTAGNTIPSSIPLQRHFTVHPFKHLVAYVLNANDVPINTNINKSIIVQDYNTKQVILSLSWIDIASIVYGETDVKKLPSAAKSLGTIISIQFYDPSILYWFRTMTSYNPHQHQNTTTDRFQALSIQTDKRIIILNLRQGPLSSLIIHTTTASIVAQQQQSTGSNGLKSTLSPYRTVLAHLHEKSIGSIPCSNILPLTDRWVLIGCIDGSLKCYDWISCTTVKKIKGLGKGDWIVQLLSANRYNIDADILLSPSSSSSTSALLSPTAISGGGGGAGATGTSTATNIPLGALSSGLRRILTVTKKGILYLIEIEIDLEKNVMDIQPPLGRFYLGSPVEAPAPDATVPGIVSAGPGGSSDASTTSSTSSTNLMDMAIDTSSTNASSGGSVIMEHCIISYDAHMDRILWVTVPSKTKQQGIVNTPVTASNSTNVLTLSVWNLRSLQTDFLQQASLATASGNSSKNLFKPDPTLVIQFPNAANHNTNTSTVVVLPAHPGYTSETIVCATINTLGDVWFYGAIALTANTTQTVIATPLVVFSLTNLVCSALPALEEQYDLHQQQNQQLLQFQHFGPTAESTVGNSLLRVHAGASQPLPSTGQSDMIVATSLGLLVLDLPALVMSQGTHHCHFGAGLGSLGKSILTVRQSTIEYAMVDALTANPIGWLEPKNPTLVYDSPVPTHLPIEYQKRPFRCPPSFISSPSGTYVCLLWSAEFRYEIVHIPTILQRVSHKLGVTGVDTAASVNRNPVVANGISVIDFAWVSDDDTYAVLYGDDAMEHSIMLLSRLENDGTDSNNAATANLKQIVNVANLKLQATTKIATTTVTKGATTAASKVTAATQGVRVGAKNVTKEVFKKSFKMFTGGSKSKTRRGTGTESEAGSAITADDEEDESEVGTMNIPSAAELAALELAMKNNNNNNNTTVTKQSSTETRQRYVELKRLVATSTSVSAPELGSSTFPAASAVSLGEITLRGGKQNIPTALFGGPVLCIASTTSCTDINDNNKDTNGQAHFYTPKKMDNINQPVVASLYVTSGPTLPYPDSLVWDDDGRLCAVVVENRVAVYLSNEPIFILLGIVTIVSPTTNNGSVTNIKFVHGVLYCCTWNSIHCIMIGDLDGGLCKLDSFVLASTDVPAIPRKLYENDRGIALWPTSVPLPLIRPTILGYQSGSLLVSTLRGIHAVPLVSPIMRIGLLLASGQIDRAVKWFDAVSNYDHEALASFLERRGRPELAMQLPGLSLYTLIDMSMRLGYVDKLEEIVEMYGINGLRSIDLGRGVTSTIFGPDPYPITIVVSVGAYLLAHDRVELVRRLATECIRSGGLEGRKDAFMLGTLLMPVDEDDASRLISRAVEQGGDISSDDWLIGKFVRQYLLSVNSNQRRV